MATIPHNLRNVTVVPTASVMENFEALVLKGDIADPTSAANGAGMVAFNPALNYVAGTIGAGVQDGYVNVMWFLTQAERTDVKARTLTIDLTAKMQAAHIWANGRPVYYPRGAYKFSSILLGTVGDGIVGDHSGGLLGGDGTLLVSNVGGTSGAIHLVASTAHNVLLSNFTLKQGGAGAQGRGIVADDCYWLTTVNVRVTGFIDNLYQSRAIYHHHKRLLSENSVNGVNYWGLPGEWNVNWYNNVITFDTCRFSNCSVTGASIKGTEIIFIAPDFSGMNIAGAIGCRVYGDSPSNSAHGIEIVAPYIESTQIGFSFVNSIVTIRAGGFVQGGPSPAGQYTSIIDADRSTVFWDVPKDQDYWAFGYRLTNNSTLTMRAPFGGSIRSVVGLTDATSGFLSDAYASGSFAVELTGCATVVSGVARWEKRGNTVTLLLPALSGDSNSTTASIIGLPAQIFPNTEQFGCLNLLNSGAEIIGSFRIFTDGLIALSSGAFGAAFSATGVKAIRGTTLTYSAS